jgi:hypothetical protein
MLLYLKLKVDTSLTASAIDSNKWREPAATLLESNLSPPLAFRAPLILPFGSKISHWKMFTATLTYLAILGCKDHEERCVQYARTRQQKASFAYRKKWKVKVCYASEHAYQG